MRIVRIIAIIVGSALFVPVSCTVGIFTGTFIVASLDSRDVSKGDSVHSLFSLVTESKNNQGSFWFLSLDQAEQLKETSEPFSYLMSNSTGSTDDGSSIFTYQVLENHNNEQIIEVIETYKDGDNTIWSRYRATDKNIYPLSSRMFYFGYMFSAIPFAFIFSLILYLAGRIVKRHIRAKEKQTGNH